MFRKTSSVEFLKYGDVCSDCDSFQIERSVVHDLPVQNHALIYMYEADQDVYLCTASGICMLVVSEKLDRDSFQTFVIHRYIKINKGVFFNFIALSEGTALKMAFSEGTQIRNRFFEKEYTYSHIVPRLQIKDLIAYYYNVRGLKYSFPGEQHSFWELTYVDSGSLKTVIDGTSYEVGENQCIFYAPGQFHSQYCENRSCSYLTVVVDMQIIDSYREKLINRVFTADRDARRAIEMFVASDSKLSVYDREMMILSLERTILCLLKSTELVTQQAASTPMQQKFENEMLEQILLYINENLYSPVNVEELCKTFTLSRSTLQSLFRQNLGVAPKEYISSLKLKKSKTLIRESKFTLSEIAAMLGYSSIHYFSRKFKQEFGMNPSEYANTLM
ncbi:MAG: AraC family transcriptional regulator [Erysipelotrichaceae bacterium]|nr:AraC family transcriptional regulator [Erysipelotrichaceae bacterium]